MASAETTRDWIKVCCVIIVAITAVSGLLFGLFASKSDITRLDEKIDLKAELLLTEMRKGFDTVNAKLDTVNAKLDNAQDDRSLIREDIERVENNIQLLNQNHIKHLQQQHK